MSEFNIVFAADSNYLPYTFVAVQSIIDHADIAHNSSDSKDVFVFNILVDDSVNIKDLESRCDAFSARNHAAAVDSQFKILHVDKELFKDFPQFNSSGSYSTYYRMVIDEIFDETVKKVLYLDVDMLILADVRELFNSVDLTNHIYAAALDSYLFSSSDKYHLIKKSGSGGKDKKLALSSYVNAGMLLISLDNWRAANIRQKCIECMHTIKVKYHDQDVLNYLVEAPVFVSTAWNMQTSYLGCITVSNGRIINMHTKKTVDESLYPDSLPVPLAQCIENPRIVHFVSHKPWVKPYQINYGDTPPVFTHEHFKWVNQWFDTAERVPEFAEALSGLRFDHLICANTNIQSLNQRLIIESNKRRTLRNQMIALNLSTFFIMLVLLILFAD